jgi:hypothetical protein
VFGFRFKIILRPVQPFQTQTQCRVQHLLNAAVCRPWENELIAREIQETRDALEAFKAAVEAGEMTGFKNG